jgi:hypothetical protein
MVQLAYSDFFFFFGQLRFFLLFTLAQILKSSQTILGCEFEILVTSH